MKYYRMKYDSMNVKATGTQLQCERVVKIGDIQNNTIINEDGIPKNTFELPEPLLDDKAKQTTLLNVVAIPNWFLVVKDYFIDFLQQFEIGESKKWKIKVHNKKQSVTGYTLFITTYPKQAEYVDYASSSFFIGKYSDYQHIGKTVNITTYERYLNIREILDEEEDKLLKHNKIVLNLSKAQEDMFRLINLPLGGYFVSERLKVAIEEQRFTGIAFQEIEETDSRIQVIY